MTHMTATASTSTPTPTPNPTTTTTLQLRPLPVPLAGEPTTATTAATVAVDAPNSYPCRRCLRDGLVGEMMRLVSYDPFLGTSPYTGSGPIFVHERECESFEGDGIPDQLRRRFLAVRGYDEAHFLQSYELVEGTDLEETAVRMLANDEIAYLHAHYAGAGCFAVRVDRTA
jgi:hypothetical protein